MKPKGKLIHGLAGDYYQDAVVKTCAVCGALWAADITFCPYCHVSQDARVAYVMYEKSKGEPCKKSTSPR